MIRTVTITPLIPDWIAYQVDELDAAGQWQTVAARGRTDDTQAGGAFATAVAFSDTADTYRVVWVGPGGSKNMRISDATKIAGGGQRRRLGGA